MIQPNNEMNSQINQSIYFYCFYPVQYTIPTELEIAIL